jgi:hypothetical protein
MALQLVRKLRDARAFVIRVPSVRALLAVPLLWLPFGLPALYFGALETAIPSVELCACAGLLWLGAGQVRALSWLVRILMGVLYIERIDRALISALMGEVPLFYDQLFMVRHLFVLVSDLWSVRTFAIVVGALLAALASFALVRYALRELELAAAGTSLRQRAVVPLSLVGVALGLALNRELRPLFFQAPVAAADLQASVELYRTVGSRLRDSPYDAHHAVKLDRKPNVYLFLIESYGRLMFSRGPEGDAHRARMLELEEQLEELGWSTASAFSRAPVMGGRSWLAEASVLTGMRVRHEAVFRHLIAQIDSVPHLVATLRRNEYRSILLVPSDRVRPGVELVNYYGFDRVIRFDDLGYQGAPVGWGIVPDQYSLEHTHEHVLSKVSRPLFFDFHMVSSHAPWDEVPTIVSDYRRLARGEAEPELDEHSMLHTRLKRYQRRGRFRFLRRGLNQVEGQRDAMRRYQQAIRYEIDVLARYLPRIEDDALIVLMGDHQPPMLMATTQDFAVPVHVLARDPNLLVPLWAAGFRPGLRMHAAQREVLRHEGLYSLLVHALAVAGSEAEPPPYLKRGVRLGE